MKINVLRNFGLDGQDLQAGTAVTVNKSHFGDNEASFREAGFFEDFTPEIEAAEPASEPKATKPEAARKPKKATEAEPAPTAPEPPAEPEAPAADDPA